VLSLFCGDPALAHPPSVPAALDAEGVDCVGLDVLLGGAAHDLGLPSVQSAVLRRIAALEFGAVILATPCSAVSILRDDAKAPALFDRAGPIEPCPQGWEEYRERYLRLVSFTCEVIELADALGIPWVIENPADVAAAGPSRWSAKSHLGSFWIHERVLQMRARVAVEMVTFAQCSFGCRFRKWTTLAFSASLAPAFAGWRRFGCVHGYGAHAAVAAGTDEAGTSLSRAAAAYPGPMNKGIGAGVGRIVATAAALSAPAASSGTASTAPLLSPAVRAACDHACAQRPRFASYRNLRPASDAELRAAPFPALSPPTPPVPRRPRAPCAANPWPPGAWERRPIAIEDLHEAGVYAGFEAALLEGEAELQAAAAEASLGEDLQEWQRACAARLLEHGGKRKRASARTLTIPNARMAWWARGTLWDTTDRDDCVPLVASTADTIFPGELQLDRKRARTISSAMAWGDADLDDQLDSGLEARTGCPRDTVVSLHHPGLYAHFGAAAKVIAGDIRKQWVRPAPRRQGGRPPHPPTIPCKADPRDVIMRLVTRVRREPDGSHRLEDVQKARVSSNLSFGGDASLNSGIPDEEKAVWLPSVQQFGRATAMSRAAFTPEEPPPKRQHVAEPPPSPPPPAPPPGERQLDDAALPPPRRQRASRWSSPPSAAPPAPQPLAPATPAPLVGMYALDLSSAYRYVCIQLLDLWCHNFLWLDAGGRLGIFTDTRLCFGGAYGPNRFERITTMLAAWIERCQAEFNALRPYPAPVVEWQAFRRDRQRRGLLPAGAHQLTPDGLQVFLDDFNGCGGLDAVAPPDGVPLIEWDVAQMLDIGLQPAARDSRLVALASIAAHEIGKMALCVAADKTMIGSSIISLGAQPDVVADSIVCPEGKRAILIEHSAALAAAVAGGAGVDRAHAEQWTGRLNNQAQFFPEIGPELHAGYSVSYARERSGRRRLLAHVPVSASSPLGLGLQRLAAVAGDALSANRGIPLAAEECFPSPGSAGVVTAVTDASGDVVSGDSGLGGYTFIPSLPARVFVSSERWPFDIACALLEDSLEPHLRTGAPRLSMPAAELYATWACVEAALDAAGANCRAFAVVAVGDCQPAAAALNRATSPVALMRRLLIHARARLQQWLGVQVPRELNAEADILSHPSRRGEVLEWLRLAGFEPTLALVPGRCWLALREAIAAAPFGGDGT